MFCELEGWTAWERNRKWKGAVALKYTGNTKILISVLPGYKYIYIVHARARARNFLLSFNNNNNNINNNNSNR